jgi:hypothetical protein
MSNTQTLLTNCVKKLIIWQKVLWNLDLQKKKAWNKSKHSFWIFWFYRSLQEGSQKAKSIFTRPSSIYHKKLFINSHGGKHMVATNGVVIVFVSLLESVHGWGVVWFIIWLKRPKIYMYITWFVKMFVNNSNLGSLNVKGCLWWLCICVNFIGVDWKPKHVRILLFKVIKISGQVHLTLKVQSLLDKYDLRKKILECKMRVLI